MNWLPLIIGTLFLALFLIGAAMSCLDDGERMIGAMLDEDGE